LQQQAKEREIKHQDEVARLEQELEVGLQLRSEIAYRTRNQSSKATCQTNVLLKKAVVDSVKVGLSVNNRRIN